MIDDEGGDVTGLTANGHPIEELADLRSSIDVLDDAGELRRRMADDGYLFLPGLLPVDRVMAARIEILTKYAVIGEVDDRHGVDEAIAGDRAALGAANLRAFSASVRSGHHYLSVTDAPEVLAVHEALLDGPVRSFDFHWPRFVRPGEGCGFHCDGPYMNRGTDTSRVFSSWIPLGRVHRHEGALMILEGSHTNPDLHAGYLAMDADRDGLVWLDDDPSVVREAYGTRWLSADFEAGDVLCFSMHTLHGAIDNASPVGRCRLTSDTRYQRIDEPADPRWNGDEIEGHGGARVFYPGLGSWNNADFADEWKHVDEHGRLVMPDELGAR